MVDLRPTRMVIEALARKESEPTWWIRIQDMDVPLTRQTPCLARHRESQCFTG